MSGKRTMVDFDAFRAEYRANKQPIQIMIGGQTEELLVDLPADLMIDLMARMSRREGDQEISLEFATANMSELLGEETFRDLLRRHRLDLAEMMWLFEQLMRLSMGGDDPQGNALAPLEQPSTSSTNGLSSKRTSKATTV